MTRLGQILRKQMVEEFLGQLRLCSAFFIIKTTGLTAQDMGQLRRILKSNSSRCSIIKNTISKVALKEFKLDGLINMVDGPSAFIFSLADPVGTSKALINFNKEYKTLIIEGGYWEGRIIPPETVKQLASLPSREVLLAKIAFGIKSPLFNLAFVLSNVLREFPCILRQICKKKETL